MNLETRSEHRTPPVVGRLLRDWRMSQGLSQMDLAERSGFSARHVSFIETGRTQPSRQALLVLAESLDLPLRERNRLLEVGGFARVFSETPRPTRWRRSDRCCSSSSIVKQRHQCEVSSTISAAILARRRAQAPRQSGRQAQAGEHSAARSRGAHRAVVGVQSPCLEMTRGRILIG